MKKKKKELQGQFYEQQQELYILENTQQTQKGYCYTDWRYECHIGADNVRNETVTDKKGIGIRNKK